MSLSLLDQYLRVIPTLGVQASQTQYVNNLRAGYSDSASSNVSLLNLFSVDGAQNAKVNIISKSGTRLYAGAGQNDADFLNAATSASKQYAEFTVNGVDATLHVPELASSVLRLGAAGSANASTMSYLTLTNATGVDGIFQQVSTTDNYLELTSAAVGNTVMIAGAAGMLVENDGSNVTLEARVGNMTLNAAAGDSMFLNADGGMSLTTSAGDFAVSAPAGDASLIAAGLVNVQTTAGDMTLTSTLGNVAVTAAQTLSGDAAVVDLAATTTMLLSSGGAFTTTAVANVTIQSTGDSVNLLANDDIVATATLGNIAVTAAAGSYTLNAQTGITESTATGSINRTAVAGSIVDIANVNYSLTTQTGNVSLVATTGQISGTASTDISLVAQTGAMTLEAETAMDLTSIAGSIDLAAAAGSITGSAQNLTWTSTDSGSPFVVTQREGTFQIGGLLPGGIASNVHLYVEGNSVFYGNVDIRGVLNRVVVNDIVLEVKDKVINIADTDTNTDGFIADYDQHNAGIQLKTPTITGQEDHSKYLKWFSSGSGAVNGKYLDAMGIMDNASDAARWVLRGGDLWLERTITDISNNTSTVAFGFVITKDMRLALVRKTGTYSNLTEEGPAVSSGGTFETMQFFGTAVDNLAGLGMDV